MEFELNELKGQRELTRSPSLSTRQVESFRPS
jgi:hypothetical protein